MPRRWISGSGERLSGRAFEFRRPETGIVATDLGRLPQRKGVAAALRIAVGAGRLVAGGRRGRRGGGGARCLRTPVALSGRSSHGGRSGSRPGPVVALAGHCLSAGCRCRRLDRLGWLHRLGRSDRKWGRSGDRRRAVIPSIGRRRQAIAVGIHRRHRWCRRIGRTAVVVVAAKEIVEKITGIGNRQGEPAGAAIGGGRRIGRWGVVAAGVRGGRIVTARRWLLRPTGLCAAHLR